MPAADYSSYHQASGTGADGTKFSNFIDAVQASVNALDKNNLAAAAGILASQLADPTAGKVLGSAGSACAAVFPPGYELHYSEITSNQNVTGTTAGSPTTVLAGASVTYDGTAVIVEFYTPNLSRGTSNINVALYEDGAVRAVLAFVSTAAQLNGTWKFRFTPSAGAHTYSIRGYVDAGTGSVAAGAGTAGANAPAFLRITKA